jgi:glutathione synthase/RimK-type ligase-like ATP-grasp enzyme
MNKIVNLDVLVVYSYALSLSASVSDSESKHPFHIDSRESNYNQAYAYFLESCEKQGLSAGMASSVDVIGPGTCKCYWTYSSGNWHKVNENVKSTQIFDKLSPTTPEKAKQKALLLSDPSIIPFNEPDVELMFSDKLLTYNTLKEFSIPTVDVHSSKIEDVQSALSNLQALVTAHPYAEDFGTGLILKDRYGVSGNFVFKIEDDFAQRILRTMSENKDVHFIIQPFLKFDKGYAYKNNVTSTDVRLIFHRNALLQCYVRMAKPGALLCNEHQGGQLEYMTVAEIPDSIHEVSNKIVAVIDRPSSLYALDFVITNSGNVFLLEGNIGPGVDWDLSKKINEEKSKELIDSIVAEFKIRIKDQHTKGRSYIHQLLVKYIPFLSNFLKANN